MPGSGYKPPYLPTFLGEHGLQPETIGIVLAGGTAASGALYGAVGAIGLGHGGAVRRRVADRAAVVIGAVDLSKVENDHSSEHYPQGPLRGEIG